MLSPTVRPNPKTMLTTPGGSPASRMSPHSIQAVTLVISLGLHTTVLPVMMAGAILKVSRYSGRFQGEMRPATPTGCLLEMFTTPAPPTVWEVSSKLCHACAN